MVSVSFSFFFFEKAYLGATCALPPHQHGLFLPRCSHLGFICGESPSKTSVYAAPETEACEIFSQSRRPRKEQIMVFDPKGAAGRHSGAFSTHENHFSAAIRAGECRLNTSEPDVTFPKSLFLLTFKVGVFRFEIRN